MLGSRRHRPPPKQPLTAATAHPNAAMAAVAVFKSREQQPASLSAAAAAAALRARPMTPTNVGQVQTKRTSRRSASVSSAGTAPDARGRPDLHRRGSSASMTERTFRSPSPGPRRPSSSASDRPLPSREPAPPVPALPKNVNKMANASHRKAQSLQLSNPPLRLASETLGKPGAGSWYGAAQVGDLSSVRTSDAAMASPPLSPPPRITHPADDERPDSRNSSANFSYPSRVRIASPAPSPTAAGGFESQQPLRAQDHAAKRAASGSSSVRMRPASVGAVQSMVYDPNSRRMVPREVPTYDDHHDYSGTALSVRRKKKQPAQTGTHLAQATMGRSKVAPTAASYVDTRHSYAAPPTAQSAAHDERQQNLTTAYYVVDDEAEDTADDEPLRTAAPSELEQPRGTGHVPFATHAAQHAVDKQPHRLPQHVGEEDPALTSLARAPGADTTESEQPRIPEVLVPHSQDVENDDDGPQEFTWVGQGVRRHPSTVREEPELEEEATRPQASRSAPQTLEQPALRQPQPNVTITEAERQPLSSHAQQPAVTSSAPEPKPAPVQARRASGVQRERSVSSSPARTARFGTVQDSLTVRHCPPPRSVSPRKSALKHSTSPDRHASIDDNVSEASTTFSQRDDTLGRKKSVRVSFDDSNNIVVAESPGPNMGDSPVVASPQNARRPWYNNIGRAKQPEMASLDDDEIMRPRPVLPSFGSVRDKKPRDISSGNEERPLVRPVSVDQSTNPSTSASPSSLPAIPHVSDELRRDTSLHAMTTGGHSTQPQSDQQAAADTSRFREPLPPVVTSIEGSGYVSDSSSSEEGQTQGAGFAELGRLDDMSLTNPSEPPVGQRDAAPDISMLSPSNRLSQTSATSSDAEFQDAASISEDRNINSEQGVPHIAISAPTPPPTKFQSSTYFGFPGGFPEDESDPSAPEPERHPGSSHVSTNDVESPSTPVRQATFEPVTQHRDSVLTPHTPATVAATVAPVAPIAPVVDDGDESSIYSDAPDHFTDTENDGFMSLDAVVESPLPARAKTTKGAPPMVETPPRLGTELSTATTAVETSQSGEPTSLDWDKAKAYWRSLTADKRAQLEQEALSDAGIDADVEEAPEVSQKPKKKKSIERRNSERKALAVHIAQQTIAAQQKKDAEEERIRAAERTYMIKPGTKVGADHSIPKHTDAKPKPKATATAKSTVDTTPKLRTSMRTNGATPKPSQHEQPRQHALGGKTLRPASVGSAPAATKTMRSPQRVGSPPVAAAAARNSFNPPPPIRRRGSDSSESSFRRFSRPESGQGFGFRKTLRQQSPVQNDRASARFSVRSMSPPAMSMRSTASGGMGMSMRTSLRGPANEPKSSGGGMHFGGFGKSSSKSTPKSKAGSSRFSDSSDDDTGPRTFRSRFDESSDEDDVRSSAPISIPKTMRGSRQNTDAKHNRQYQKQELSPALPEEEEESDLEEHLGRDIEKEPISPLPKDASRSGRGGLVASPPATPLEAPKSTRRGSFMSVLRRKKNKNGGGIARPEVMDSAARRDTKLERSADELKEIRRSGDLDRESEEVPVVAVSPPSSPARPKSPRLQKRTNSMPLDAVVSGWPLGTPAGEQPPSINGNGNAKLERPGTSGNLGTRTMSSNSRPMFGQRRTASSNIMARVDEGSVAGGEKKKKKFGTLRKMFGLDE